jgi:hypothetical protein
MAVSFKPDIAMLRQRSAMGQNNEGYAYEGHDWSSRMMREDDMIMCL